MSTVAPAWPKTHGSNKAAPGLDTEAIRRDFPILSRKVHGKPLVYLDNAATTQKPLAVIEAERDIYERYYANIHRGVHLLSVESTEAYEKVREKVRDFIHAAEAREIIFVRGTTEAINLVASTLGRSRVGAGDEVVITALEHHSNIVPWQMLCQEKGARLRVLPMNERGELLSDELPRLLTERTRLVAVAHLSNALGTIDAVSDIVRIAHDRGVPVLIDGAQAVARLPVDVGKLDCDFYAFSAHKLYGPTGAGVLYGKAKLLESLPPYQGGGDMISSVTFEKTTYNVCPTSSKPVRPTSPGSSVLARLWITCSPSASARSNGTRASFCRRRRPRCRRFPACASSGQRRPRRECCRSRSRACTRTTSVRCSIGKASPCARATIARSRSWTSSRFLRPRAPLSGFTTPRPKWTPWSPGFTK